jgi:acetoacetate decarboxylase
MKYEGLPRVQVISASNILTDFTLTPVKPVFDYLKESTK